MKLPTSFTKHGPPGFNSNILKHMIDWLQGERAPEHLMYHYEPDHPTSVMHESPLVEHICTCGPYWGNLDPLFFCLLPILISYYCSLKKKKNLPCSKLSPLLPSYRLEAVDLISFNNELKILLSILRSNCNHHCECQCQCIFVNDLIVLCIT